MAGKGEGRGLRHLSDTDLRGYLVVSVGSEGPLSTQGYRAGVVRGISGQAETGTPRKGSWMGGGRLPTLSRCHPEPISHSLLNGSSVCQSYLLPPLPRLPSLSRPTPQSDPMPTGCFFISLLFLLFSVFPTITVAALPKPSLALHSHGAVPLLFPDVN